MRRRDEPDWFPGTVPFRRPWGNEPFPSRWLGIGLLIFVVVLIGWSSTYVIDPGNRGIRVTLGKADSKWLSEGFGMRAPFVTRIVNVSVRQRTQALKADCFSSDLQQVGIDLRVLYRIPDESVVTIYQQFAGDPFDSLIAPRVQEALKEVTAMETAERIVKGRENIKQKALIAARQKIGGMLRLEDVVIRDIDLSEQLERAIEAKMVAEQQAAQARFTQVQTQVEAETAVISAKGEAEGIKVRGEAMRTSPSFLRLKIVERWNGTSPLVVPSDPQGTGAALLLPLGPTHPSGSP